MSDRNIQILIKQSDKSSSLISSSQDSSDSSSSQSKYQKKQLQLSKNNKNDTNNPQKSAKNNVFSSMIQKKYNSRSRSPSSNSKQRSRSHHKKNKNKHSNHRNRSRSRQTQDSFRSKSNKNNKYRTERRQNDHQRRNKDYRRTDRRDDRRDDRRQDRKYDYDRRNKYDNRDHRDNKRYQEKRENLQRARQRQSQKKIDDKKNGTPTEIPMPLQVPMPLIPGQRRRRERSRSPLDYYRRNQSNNQGQFWDSFSWVPRINYTPNVSSSALVNTKKMRRLMITNIPFQMGISKDDLKDLITKFMTQNYLKDTMNNCPVRQLQINQQDHSASVQLSSVQQTCRMCKLQKIQLFKGTINGIVRLGDSCYGNNIVTQAQNAAQAQAAAFAAINVLQNKKTNFNMQVNLNKPVEASTLLRVTNAVTSYMASNLTPQQWKQYYQDLIEGFSQYGKIVHDWFVKQNEKDICADAGNLFIQFESQQDAVKAMSAMQGRIYDQRVIQLFYVPRQIYYPNYKKDITPPVVKAPPKIQKDMSQILPQISKSSHIATSRTNQ